MRVNAHFYEKLMSVFFCVHPLVRHAFVTWLLDLLADLAFYFEVRVILVIVQRTYICKWPLSSFPIPSHSILQCGSKKADAYYENLLNFVTKPAILQIYFTRIPDSHPDIPVTYSESC